MINEEKKDEMKNRISMALKDPILQQGFEIICKENAELKSELTKKADTNHSLVEQMAKLESANAELKEEIRQLKNEVEDLRSYCNQIGKVKTDVLKAFENILAR